MCLVLLITLQCLLLTPAFAQEDFYELLKVSRDADTAQIKKAFRKASLEYHPDKNPGKKSSIISPFYIEFGHLTKKWTFLNFFRQFFR